MPARVWVMRVAVAAATVLIIAGGIWLVRELLESPADFRGAERSSNDDNDDAADVTPSLPEGEPVVEEADPPGEATTAQADPEEPEEQPHSAEFEESSQSDEADDDVEVAREPSVIGRVVNERGEAVVDARVFQSRSLSVGISGRRPPRLHPTGTPAGLATDEDGVFRISFDSWSRFADAVVVLPPPPYYFAVHRVDAINGEPNEANEHDLGEFVVQLGAAVEGRVTDGNNRPIEDAWVVLGEPASGGNRNRSTLWMDGPVALTDAGGYYRLDGIQPGTESITAYATGYFSASQGRFEFEAGATTYGVDFTLTAAPVVHVRVTDGVAPLPLAEVRVEGRGGESINLAYTNEAGEAHFTEIFVLDREIVVTATKEGHIEARKQVALADEPVELTLVVAAEPELRLRPVDAATGEPLIEQPRRGFIGLPPVIQLGEFDHRTRRAIDASVDETGVVTLLGVPPGEWDLALVLPTHHRWEKTILLEAGKPLDLGDIALDGGTPYQVRVVNHQGEPIEGARVTVLAHHESTGMQVNLLRRDRTDAEGRCDIGTVGGERMQIRVRHDRHLDSSEEFEIVRSTETVEVEIVLDSAGLITGRVLDANGEPVPNHTVALVHAREERQRVHGRTADRDGSFRFRNLEAGRYRLTADRDAASRFGRGDDVDEADYFELAAGEHLEKDLVLDYGVAGDDEQPGLRGVLLFHDGSIASQIPLQATLEDHRGDAAQLGRTRTDAQGRFLFEASHRMRGTVLLRISVAGRELTYEARLFLDDNLGVIRLPPHEQEQRATLRVHVVDGRTDTPATATVRLEGLVPSTAPSESVRRTVEVRAEALVTDLPPGSLRVVLAEAGHAEMQRHVRLEAGEETEVRIELHERARILLRVSPPPGVTVDETENRLTIQLSRTDNLESGARASGRFNEDIEFDGFAAGKTYRLVIIHRLDGNIERTEITAPVDDRTKRINVTLSPE